MPIVKNSDLPTFNRLTAEGRNILDPNRATNQDIRPIHIGFINLMTDASLEATERQWYRLIGESNCVTQIYVHPCTLPMIKRGKKAQEHIDKYYEDFEKLKEGGLDALIITGGNTDTSPPVTDTAAWQALYDAADWAEKNVTSTIYCCLASYIQMYRKHNQLTQKQPEKVLGIFSHRVLERQHPLLRGMNTKFDAPHARTFGISRTQYNEAGMTTLIEGKESGVLTAVSKDGFREICTQGHPEYDTFSLLKEFKRDMNWFRDGKIDQPPPIPVNYFGPKATAIIEDVTKRILAGEKVDFPEQEIEPLLENTWTDSARSLMSNWIGNVYQTTHVDRRKQFMGGIDPKNPLKI